MISCRFQRVTGKYCTSFISQKPFRLLDLTSVLVHIGFVYIKRYFGERDKSGTKSLLIFHKKILIIFGSRDHNNKYRKSKILIKAIFSLTNSIVVFKVKIHRLMINNKQSMYINWPQNHLFNNPLVSWISVADW